MFFVSFRSQNLICNSAQDVDDSAQLAKRVFEATQHDMKLSDSLNAKKPVGTPRGRGIQKNKRIHAFFGERPEPNHRSITPNHRSITPITPLKFRKSSLNFRCFFLTVTILLMVQTTDDGFKVFSKLHLKAFTNSL